MNDWLEYSHSIYNISPKIDHCLQFQTINLQIGYDKFIKPSQKEPMEKSEKSSARWKGREIKELLQDARQFLMRPTRTSENLDKELRKSYWQILFKNQKFKHFLQGYEVKNAKIKRKIQENPAKGKPGLTEQFKEVVEDWNQSRKIKEIGNIFVKELKKTAIEMRKKQQQQPDQPKNPEIKLQHVFQAVTGIKLEESQLNLLHLASQSGWLIQSVDSDSDEVKSQAQREETSQMVKLQNEVKIQSDRKPIHAVDYLVAAENDNSSAVIELKRRRKYTGKPTRRLRKMRICELQSLSQIDNCEDHQKKHQGTKQALCKIQT